MTDERIRVTFDEAYSADVDQQLQQRDAVARAQTHYSQTREAAPPAAPPSQAVPRPRGDAIRALALVGFLGGLVSWAGSELVHQTTLMSQQDQFTQLTREYGALEQAYSAERITRSAFDAAVADVLRRGADNPFLQARDPSLPEAERRRRTDALQRKESIWSLVWFAIVGTTLAASLAAADSLLARHVRAAVVQGAVGGLLGLVGGLVLWLFANRLYRFLGGGVGEFETAAQIARQVFARAAAWGVLGAFLSLAPGVVLRSPKRLAIGLLGGFAGGLLGGAVFDLFGPYPLLSRLVGITAIGAGAAAATGWIEAIAKTGWVHVTAGPIQGKQFVLYRDPTHFGSSPQCEVYLFKDPQIAPRHAAIHRVSGGFELEDLGSATGTFVNGQRCRGRRRLLTGDEIQIGAVRLTFGERVRAADHG